MEYTSEELVKEFLKTGCDVFHLMGGSPGIYVEFWPELIGMLDNYGRGIFHSDLTLTEKRLNRPLLQAISQPECLYAVNVKGVSAEDYYKNTGKDFNSSMFWLNLWDLYICNVPFYMTFTNPNRVEYKAFTDHIRNLYDEALLDDSFIIDLIDYKAAKAYVGIK